jgi:CelD/BcsL family acetyltransferase involved in cellulose biosynthesis
MADAHLDPRGSVYRDVLTEPKAQAATVHGLPLGATLSVVTGADAFLALETQWLELEASSKIARSVFQSFAWLKSWVETYGPQLDCDAIRIITGYRGARLVFAWPLLKYKAGPVTVLRWLSEPASQYGDVLVASSESPKTWMADALKLIREMPGVDAIRLRHVRADAAAAPFLETAFREANLRERAPFLDLSAFADEAAYEARYTSAQHKRRKKIRTALEAEFGPLKFDVLRTGPAADGAIAAAIAEKIQWIESRGRQNRVLCCPKLMGFLKAILRNGGAGTELVVSVLSAGGREISWEIGLRHQRAHFGFITAHVNALTDYSPARLHMDLSQRQALRDGMKAFDLMHPNDPHKDSWSSARTLVSDYHLPLTTLGCAYGGLYLERLRPLLRHAYYRMPEGLLKLLKPVVRH